MTNDQLNAAAARIMGFKEAQDEWGRQYTYDNGIWVMEFDDWNPSEDIGLAFRVQAKATAEDAGEFLWHLERMWHTDPDKKKQTCLKLWLATAPARARVEAAVAVLEGKG